MLHRNIPQSPRAMSAGAVLDLTIALEHRCSLALFAHDKLLELQDESPRHAASLEDLGAKWTTLDADVRQFRKEAYDRVTTGGDLARAPESVVVDLERLRGVARRYEARTCEILNDALLTDLGEGD